MAKTRIGNGKLVDPFDLQPEDVDPFAFMHSICLLNRFTGHSLWPYSVGQHTDILVRYVPIGLRHAALIHDWSEALFNDLSSPVKHELPLYCQAEKRAARVIADRMGVHQNALDAVDTYDKRIYVNERDACYETVGELGMGDDRIRLDIPAWEFDERDWYDVRSSIHTHFYQLFPEWGTA